MHRRTFLQTSTLATLATLARADTPLPPVRAITRGPGFHWFGYYDKFQFDPTGRYVLGMKVGFEGRSPAPDDVIEVGMVDLQEGDRWQRLGETRAWNWQQGCMLQWLPGTESTVLWNDREGERFVTRILDVRTGAQRTLPKPIYTVSPDGRTGIVPDFARLNHTRPGYGYAGLPDLNVDVLAPENSGIWTVDLATGESRMLFSLAQIAALPWEAEGGYGPKAKHWFNHLLFSPDGKRFIFLHRWRAEGEPIRTFHTRLFTVNADGSDPYILDPSGFSSHFVWRDPEYVFLYTYHPKAKMRFYVMRDKTREVEPMGPDVMTVNGHNTYVPGTDNQWVLNDTYPQEGKQHVYLYHVPTGRRVPLGAFASPEPYRGEWRCDTHPRSSRDGRTVCIDSPHEGGRQMYLIDIRGIVG